MTGSVIEVKDLSKVYFDSSLMRAGQPSTIALNKVSIELREGEVLGLVGESGCGKSTLARIVARLDSATSGDVLFKDRSITNVPRRKSRAIHRDIQYVFQDPISALNPRRSVWASITEPLRAQGIYNKSRAMERATALLARADLNVSILDKFPHQLSGGQAQRICIVRALMMKPSVVILDEAVSALDLSVQAHVLNSLMDLRDGANVSMIFVSHDLSVVSHVSDRVAVMYLGHIVEIAGVKQIYERSQHPYSRALLSAAPINSPLQRQTRERIVLKGSPAAQTSLTQGCIFYSRCWKAQPFCSQVAPTLTYDGASDSAVACHFPVE